MSAPCLPHRVGPLEYPILPRAEPPENLRLHRLRPRETQARLHADECVGREARPLLDGDPHLVLPVDVVRDEGHDAKRFRGLGIEAAPDRVPERIRHARLLGVAHLQPGQAVDGRVRAEVEGAEHHLGRRDRLLLVLLAPEHVGPVRAEHQLEQGAREAARGLDERDLAPADHVQALQDPLPEQPDLAHEPVIGVGVEERVVGGHPGENRPRASGGATSRSRARCGGATRWRRRARGRARGARSPLPAPSIPAASFRGGGAPARGGRGPRSGPCGRS